MLFCVEAQIDCMVPFQDFSSPSISAVRCVLKQFSCLYCFFSYAVFTYYMYVFINAYYCHARRCSRTCPTSHPFGMQLKVFLLLFPQFHDANEPTGIKKAPVELLLSECIIHVRGGLEQWNSSLDPTAVTSFLHHINLSCRPPSIPATHPVVSIAA